MRSFRNETECCLPVGSSEMIFRPQLAMIREESQLNPPPLYAIVFKSEVDERRICGGCRKGRRQNEKFALPNFEVF